ncbi:MAG: hypothetical protein HKN47_13885 [Pirellulaceae bacterium]|nr:hypothetical protein [Pirellulaceae bacterium]
MRVSRRKFAAAAASLMMLGSVGCASMSADRPRSKSASLADRLPWGTDKEDEDANVPYPNPVKMAATWTPDTLIQTGRTPTRGFGGRLFFYDEKSRPVPVEGTLIVHAFDEAADNPKDGVKRYEFTPEQFTRHFSKSDFGASYSIWVPWDAIGGDRKRISLVASFKTAEGRAVQGIPAIVMLPGAEPVESPSDKLSKLSPQFRQYQDAIVSGETRQSGLTTTTIKRRQYSPGSTETDAIKAELIDSLQENAALIAQGSSTPSGEISMMRRPESTVIRPASAELPATARLPSVKKR